MQSSLVISSSGGNQETEANANPAGSWQPCQGWKLLLQWGNRSRLCGHGFGVKPHIVFWPWTSSHSWLWWGLFLKLIFKGHFTVPSTCRLFGNGSHSIITVPLLVYLGNTEFPQSAVWTSGTVIMLIFKMKSCICQGIPILWSRLIPLVHV